MHGFGCGCAWQVIGRSDGGEPLAQLVVANVIWEDEFLPLSMAMAAYTLLSVPRFPLWRYACLRRCRTPGKRSRLPCRRPSLSHA
jgi:hypothetical protein